MNDESEELKLLLRLHRLAEPIPDRESAALLLDRSLYHFMRLTTLRRNNRLSVSEHELTQSLEIVDAMFQNPSLLRLCNDEEVSGAVCVLLDELLCFLDENSAERALNDPPSLNCARLTTASNLLSRLGTQAIPQQTEQRSSSTDRTALVRGVFRQTLPGVMSRSILFFTRTLNAAASMTQNKLSRDTCCLLLRFVKNHLEGCDFFAWLKSANHKDAVAAFIRISKLVATSCESVMALVASHINCGGVPPETRQDDEENAAEQQTRTEAMSCTSAWFDSPFRSRFGENLCSLLSLLVGQFCNRMEFPPSLDEHQRNTANAAKSELRIAATRCWLVSCRWLWSGSDEDSASEVLSASASILSVADVEAKWDELCFDPSSNLRSVVLHDAVASFLSQHKQRQSQTGAAEANEPLDPQLGSAARSKRLFRQFVKCFSDCVRSDLGLSNQNSAAGASSLFVFEQTSLSNFERWLVSTTICPDIKNGVPRFTLPSNSALKFLMLAASAAAAKGEFWVSDGAAAAASEDLETNAEAKLLSWLEHLVVPILEDAYEFEQHHAVCILVICVVHALLRPPNLQQKASNGDANKMDALTSFLWSDAWSALWEGVVLSHYPRTLSENWDSCSGAQKKFRVTIVGLLCRLIAFIGCGLADQCIEKRRSRKKKSAAKAPPLPDAADRFLLLAVRELLDIASTEFDFHSIAREAAMSSLKTIAVAFFPLLVRDTDFESRVNSNASCAEAAPPSSSSSTLSSQRISDALRTLMRHCMSPIVDVCVRALKSPTSTEELLSNARILHVSSLLCVEQVSNCNQTVSAAASSASVNRNRIIAELTPSILAVAEVCSEILRRDVSATSTESNELFRAARGVLLKIGLCVADFVRAAQRQQDKIWVTAAAAAATDPKPKPTVAEALKSGNIIRELYRCGILQRSAEPGQVRTLSSDNDWIDSEDFSAFCEPSLSKLHAIIINILGSAVAALGTQYSASAFSSSSSSMLLLPSTSFAARSLDDESDGSESSNNDRVRHQQRWSIVAGSSSGSVQATAARAQQRAGTASKAERSAAIQLCVACLNAVSTSTPTSYFEPVAANEQEPSKVLVTSKSGKPTLRVSRAQWTSCFKVFHALQSLLLSSRPAVAAQSHQTRNTGGFRDIAGTVAFFHRFVAALERYKALASSSTKRENDEQHKQGETAATATSNTRAFDAARIELRNCTQTLKDAHLLADESIAQVPSACVCLVLGAPVFLLFRMQTEMLPLLALQWLALCCEKEPEVWSFLMSSRAVAVGDNGDSQQNCVPLPRSVVGKNLRDGILELKLTCLGKVGNAADDNGSSQNESEVAKRANDDLRRVVSELVVSGLG